LSVGETPRLAWIGIAAASIACARAYSSAGTDAGGAAQADGGVADRAGAPAAVDRVAAAEENPVRDALISADLPPTGAADAACATESAVAETLPLDLYVMMDSSESMTEETAAGPTKWEAVRRALVAFLGDPQSAGIGVGLQYFPLRQPGVPERCTADAMCGSFGPCERFRTCFGPGTTAIAACATNSDCRPGETCIPLGTCPMQGGSCAPLGAICPSLTEICVDALAGYCRGLDSCELAAYATPAVPIASLPGAGAALVASLEAREPAGGTPTGPALGGAISHAQARATANPGRKLAVLLVTDGAPSECTPREIAAVADLAAGGAAGVPAVPTFVVGVFAPEAAAAASANLDLLARRGGTGSAVIIDTGQNVTQALQAALAQIRTTAVACEYRIPPPTGGAIDFGKVNVEVTATDGTTSAIGYVGDRASCDPARGGWYYDVNPAAGRGAPTAIHTCEATCARLRSEGTARVDIVLGCQTITID
jgi:hypothetical protein